MIYKKYFHKLYIFLKFHYNKQYYDYLIILDINSNSLIYLVLRVQYFYILVD